MPSLMPVYYILQGAHHQTTAGSDNETSGLPLRLVPKTAKLANIDNVDKPQWSIGLSSMSSTQANWIGSDEAGKGDYFGPLVVAAVLVDGAVLGPLGQLGVKDSKRLADASVERLAGKIRGSCIYAIVPIGPEKYNHLYSKIQNLNRLLAWGHARAIENILNREECSYALADQFGDENFLISALLSKGRTIQVKQQTGAESDIAVAAASILARAEFLRRLAQLSAKYQMKLPKGASSVVIQAGKEFITRYGNERLREVAKIHFKTTRSVLAD